MRLLEITFKNPVIVMRERNVRTKPQNLTAYEKPKTFWVESSEYQFQNSQHSSTVVMTT